MRSLFGLGLVPLVVAMSLGIACGNNGKESSKTTPGPTAAGTAAGETETMSALKLNLNEWSITGEKGGAIPSVKAGEVTLEVHNDGQIPHELVVIKTNTDPANLPLDGEEVDEEAAGAIGEVEPFPGGAVKDGTFSLQPGTYALICNIPGHYKQGMHAQLIVE